MKKKIILRGILGFPIGIAIGYVITIFSSLIWAGGYYSPCVPELVSKMGSEIKAVLLQALLCGLLGSGTATGSVIWELEHWGVVKQTGVYFLLISALMLPMAYSMYWMEHSVKGFFEYFGIFTLIFIFIWLVQFATGRYQVNQLNEKLGKVRKEKK